MATAVKPVDPSENEILAELEAKAKKPNLFYRGMAHRPDVLKNFPAFYGAVMGPGPTPRRIKELVYLACSYTNQCEFCIHAHEAGARKAGITEEELQALQAGNDTALPAEEQAAVAYARELTKTADAAASREELKAYFSDDQIVEITLVAATSNFTNRFNNGLQIKPE